MVLVNSVPFLEREFKDFVFLSLAIKILLFGQNGHIRILTEKKYFFKDTNSFTLPGLIVHGCVQASFRSCSECSSTTFFSISMSKRAVSILPA